MQTLKKSKERSKCRLRQMMHPVLSGMTHRHQRLNLQSLLGREFNVSNSLLDKNMTDQRLDGLPSILELLRVLVNVLDPNDQKHTDSTRLTVLGILNTAFEEAGPRIPDFPSLKALIIDPGCKFLFQLARSDNTSVLHAALRTISTMFDTMRRHLKLQQELFLAFTIDRLAPPLPTPKQLNKRATTYAGSPRPGTPAPETPLLAPAEQEKDNSTQPRPLVPPAQGQTRDLLLETLNQIARHSSFMVDVYTNYDCDINCENLLERLIEFLTKVEIALYLSISFLTIL